MDKKELAAVILRAQELQEMSWNGKKYTLNHQQAAEKALGLNDDPAMATVVYLLNKLAWNEIQDWAKENIK